MIDWDDFKVVLAIYDEGSLLGAAKQLGINQATVGRRLTRIEGSLEVKLFDRMAHGLFPTKAGLLAVEAALSFKGNVDSVIVNLKGLDQSLEGTLRISIPLNLLPFGLSGDLNAFRKEYPNIQFDVLATDAQSSFTGREVDVVIRAENDPSSGLWGYKIADICFSFYASREFLATWQSEMESNSETVRLPYIKINTADPNSDANQLLKRFPMAQPIAECNSLDSMIPMVRSGMGVGRMARFMAHHFDELLPVHACDPGTSRSLWILTLSNFRNIQKTQLFMEFIRDRFKRREGQF